ncbi:hypothetical protein AVEN_107787-1 [Araneus ventricosus]|uniref:Uncharacterized protein n=1 Tax=Araneus ventricosus TaxID=182803 RepID=A0A4Y2I3W1_ARAVE|nr:hypothetical protein AVEN_107787-1 [Araneus ventricosus]
MSSFNKRHVRLRPQRQRWLCGKASSSKPEGSRFETGFHAVCTNPVQARMVKRAPVRAAMVYGEDDYVLCHTHLLAEVHNCKGRPKIVFAFSITMGC